MEKIKKIDAVLPLLLKDYDRFEILNKSMKKFCSDLINTCWIVTKESEYKELNKKIHNWFYRVIPESLVIPELRFYRFIRRAPDGWQVQQLIKLAIAHMIETDFYLTLDSDVICIRHISPECLIRNGKAVITIEGALHLHPSWYKDAERLLGFSGSGLSHGVTPAILNKYAVFALQEFLTRKVNPLFRIPSIFFSKTSIASQLIISWRSFLIRNIPWTEYSLYNTFLEGKNLFEKYHFRGGHDAIYDGHKSVWFKEHWEGWNFEESISGKGFFLVIQSNTDIPAHLVWNKFQKHLEQ
jgi:hypothetical protein